MKKPLPTIGVDKYTFFNVVSDDENGTVYGEGINLKGIVEIAPTDAGGSDTFDADNGAYETASYISLAEDGVVTGAPTIGGASINKNVTVTDASGKTVKKRICFVIISQT